jgi:quinoprotein glucose dehydrogenase
MSPLFMLALALAAPSRDDTKQPPRNDEGITVPAGFAWDEWAREPLVPDPVAFTVLPDGSLFVCESERQDRGVEDNRYSPYWLLEDLNARTVDDRLAIYRKWATKKEGGMDWYTRWSDRVRRLRDTDGDGKADRSDNFSGDLREPLDGTAAGVLKVDDAIWVTSIPHVWRFMDRDGDGVAEVRERLFTGFGVRTSLRGHDMHGLVQGPDARIYWSIGDRGYSVRTREGALLESAGTGAVFRCEPDGSRLEVFCRGLRNPQELAFNDLGDLFTVDNNSDGGDKARVCLLVDGGETGWEMAFQTLEGDNKRGPWNQERLWEVFASEDPLQAGWITPPVAHLTSGPSGLVAYPGTGFPPEFDGTFLVCDFLGGDAYSQVWRFGVKPLGAGYEMVDPQIFIKDVLPTDLEFAADGRLYVSDWWNGWQSDGHGRIYRIWHEQGVNSPAAIEARGVLIAGFAHRPVPELVTLLDHADRRLRQGAHLRLAELDHDGVAAMVSALFAPEASERTRRHALWGLQVVARRRPGANAAEACAALIRACADQSAEIRAQAARALGDAGCREAAASLRPLLLDESPRVRAAACTAVGRLRDAASQGELAAVLWENDDADPWLRQAAATALARIGDRAKLQELAADQFPQVRLGAALAMRPLKEPALARLLGDPDPSVVLEAARAIHDEEITGAFPALASVADRFAAESPAVPGFGSSDPRTLPLLRRVIGANRRVGDAASAARVATLTTSPAVPSQARLLAMEAMAEWDAPGPRDPVLGRVLPLDPGTRDIAAWKRMLEARLPAIASEAPDEAVRAKALELAARVGIRLDPEAAFRTAIDVSAHPRERLASVQQLSRDGGERLKEALASTLAASDPALRAASLELLASIDPAGALVRADSVLREGSLPERQAAVRTLSRISDGAASRRLTELAGALQAGRLDPELQLDVVEAAAKAQATAEAIRTWNEAKASQGPLEAHMICLEGGDAERGAAIVSGHVGAQCLRCHALAGGGGHAGPSLEGVAKRHDRRGLLQSLVDPNAKVAEGFGTTSAMPAMDALLTPREIRDVVAYLSTLK